MQHEDHGKFCGGPREQANMRSEHVRNAFGISGNQSYKLAKSKNPRCPKNVLCKPGRSVNGTADPQYAYGAKWGLGCTWLGKGFRRFECPVSLCILLHPDGGEPNGGKNIAQWWRVENRPDGGNISILKFEAQWRRSCDS